jgi:hypothetical protein
MHRQARTRDFFHCCVYHLPRECVCRVIAYQSRFFCLATGGRDLWNKRSDGLRYHGIHAKFHTDFFRHLKVNRRGFSDTHKSTLGKYTKSSSPFLECNTDSSSNRLVTVEGSQLNSLDSSVNLRNQISSLLPPSSESLLRDFRRFSPSLQKHLGIAAILCYCISLSFLFLSTQKIQASGFSETLVPNYETLRCRKWSLNYERSACISYQLEIDLIRYSIVICCLQIPIYRWLW